MLRIYIGFDPRQIIAYSVASLSLLKHASEPIAIIPLVYDTLPIKHKGLTPFTYSRYLVPWLSGFEGHSVFMDSDFMCRSDICKIPLGDEAVSVVHHEKKFERPSLMVFNNAKCKVLTPDYVNSNTKTLFGLGWAESVGKLEKEWNHLVNYDKPNENAKLIHFTQGLPCYKTGNLWDAEYGNEWREYAKLTISAEPWENLMGNSVHAPYVNSTT